MNTIEEIEEINIVDMAGGAEPGKKEERDTDYSTRIKDQREDRLLWGEGILKFFDRWFHKLDRFVESSIPSSLNPFTQSGAIANTTFIIALISGFIILIWYKPSVYQAYSSLETIDPVGGFFRALHRYSSDACMLFIFFSCA